MPAAASQPTSTAGRRLSALAQRIHARRKALKVSAGTTAEAAGMSRMTLYRIERGEPSVTMGAYMNALDALGLDVEVTTAVQARTPATLPQGIKVASYPQLRRIAWQLSPGAELAPEEAWGTYERNWRHVDVAALDANERRLLADLALALGRKPLHV